MGKIKINLTSGMVLEKPLVTCFQGYNSNYIVFDNEKNGSMGLPIICISKINGSNLDKIIDQTEWASVKENLKAIISGNKMTYLPVTDILNAPDDFFTQLTLPVASFDVLKNAYQLPTVENVQVEGNNLDVNTNNNQTEVLENNSNPTVPEVALSDTPIMPQMSDAMAISAPVVDNTVSGGTAIPTPMDINVGAPSPVNNDAIIAPPVINGGVVETTVNNETPAVSVATSNNDFSEIKSAFMKSCENMFDALVNKFQNK